MYRLMRHAFLCTCVCVHTDARRTYTFMRHRAQEGFERPACNLAENTGPARRLEQSGAAEDARAQAGETSEPWGPREWHQGAAFSLQPAHLQGRGTFETQIRPLSHLRGH